MNTYFVDGGVGKQVAFTAIIDALVNKYKEKIKIHTPYPEIFIMNSNVKYIFDGNLGIFPQHDKYLLESENIFHCEPYKSNFIKGEIHIIQSFCELLGVKYEEKMRPKIFTDLYWPNVKQIVNDDDFIVIQFSGGQTIKNTAVVRSPAGFNAQNAYVNADPSRNYPHFFAQKVIDLIKEKYENLRILNFSLPNEPHYKGIDERVDFPYVWGHEMLKFPNCKGFISIDSCLNHFARSAGRRGVVIWGSTRWTQFGYKQNRNINNWWSEWDEWDNEKFEPQDPRNIMVEPELVFEQFEKIYGKGMISI